MYKKKPFFITFEGIEGCGKSYQSLKLYKNLKKRKIPTILTREPGGTTSAEKIRAVIHVSLNGRTNNIEKLYQICKLYKIFLISYKFFKYNQDLDNSVKAITSITVISVIIFSIINSASL